MTPVLNWAALLLAAVLGCGVAYSSGVNLRADAVAPPPAAVTAPGALGWVPAAYFPALPNDPLPTSGVADPTDAPPVTPAPASALAADGIPATALLAYQTAATRQGQLNPVCGLRWQLLAAIGRVESDHGRFAGAVLHSDGLSTPRVVGIPLNGHGTALIRDTDRGRLDGDLVYDRAVGPMQFIPSTWARWGADGSGDGRVDPYNIFDAATAAAAYLCAAGGDLTTVPGKIRALLAYNHSDAYVALVLDIEAVYSGGTPGASYPVTAQVPPVGIPPVDPGRPRATTPHKPPSPTPPSTIVSSTASATPTDSVPVSSSGPTPTDPTTPSPTGCPTTDLPTGSPSAGTTGPTDSASATGCATSPPASTPADTTAGTTTGTTAGTAAGVTAASAPATTSVTP